MFAVPKKSRTIKMILCLVLKSCFSIRGLGRIGWTQELGRHYEGGDCGERTEPDEAE